MTFTEAYAKLIIPAALSLCVHQVAAKLGLPPLFTAGVLFGALYFLGDQVELYYFREWLEGKDIFPRFIRFVVGLPLVYIVSFLIGFLALGWLTLSVSVLLLALVLALGLYILCLDNHHRGLRVYTYRWQLKVAKSLLPEGDEGIPLGGVPIATDKITGGHACVIGTTGSGKTTAVVQTMDLVLPTIGKSKNSRRAIIYDPKTEWYGYASKTASCPVVSLHPFDKRGRSLDLAAIIRQEGPKAADQLAATIIPQEEGPNAFFSNAARAILRAVLTSYLRHSPEVWTLRDLILGCETATRLRAIFSRHESTRPAIAKYLEARETPAVLSTLDTFLDPFRTIAACWSKAKPFDLSEFVDGSCLLILAQDETAKEALLKINALVFQLLVERLLGYKTNVQLRAEGLPLRQSFVFLDELRDIAARLPGLTALKTRGRAFGISVLDGFQSRPGLMDAVNQNRAPELIGQSSYLGMLRVNEEETAKYFSSICGEREVYRKSTSQSANGNSASWQLVREPVLLPSAFQSLPTDRFAGFFMAPAPLGLWRMELPWPHRAELDKDRPPDFIKRETAEQYLEPWTKEDPERLSLPPTLLDDEARGQSSPGPKPPPPPKPPDSQEQGLGKPRLRVINQDR
jgi:type IV secretory pathway TraG/TraD family ATPase VirD4